MHYKKLNNRSLYWICILCVSTIFFHLFSNICFPFIVGFVLAYLFAPTVDFFSKYVSRTFVSLSFVLLTVCAFVFICSDFIPKLKECLIFLNNKIPHYYSNFIRFIDDVFEPVNMEQNYIDMAALKSEIQKYLDKKIYILASLVGRIASKKDAIVSFFSFFIITPISFFYFLKDWNFMNKYIYESIPYRQKEVFSEICVLIRQAFKNFLNGQLYVVLILSFYYSISLLTIGIPYNMYLGIMSGVLSFIPFIGAMLSCFIVLFVSVSSLTTAKFYVIIVLYFLGQFLEGYFLYPKFVGRKTGLHPLWILFSFFAGVELNGIIGVLIAIPSAAVIRSLVGFAIDKFKATQAYKQ